jgi:probable F420-dependent oxidoreductase
MKFGFTVPGYGPLTTPDDLSTLARRGEEMGFDIICVSDHIVIPKSIEAVYPYSESGEYYAGPARDYIEMLITMSFLIGQTSDIRLLTSVMVMPHRSPVLTAKMLTTIDVLSKGRLDVGCGIGWMREEFVATGAPPFEERGAVSNEYIRAFKELWTSDNPTFEGKYCRFSNIDFLPRPVQKPHPPIWIGGESPPALRRTGRLADMWYPISNNPRFPMVTPEQVSDGYSRVHRHAEKAGRDPSEIGLAYNSLEYSEPEPHILPSGERRRFTGAPEQIAEDIRAWEGLGTSYLMFNFHRDLHTDSVDQILERMERFATKVKPLVEG